MTMLKITCQKKGKVENHMSIDMDSWDQLVTTLTLYCLGVHSHEFGIFIPPLMWRAFEVTIYSVNDMDSLEGMLSKPTLPFSDAGLLSTAAATVTRSLTAAVTAVRVEPGWHGWRLPDPPNPVMATGLGWVAISTQPGDRHWVGLPWVAFLGWRVWVLGGGL